LNLFRGFFIEDLEEQEKLRLRIVKDLKEAVNPSEKIGDAHRARSSILYLSSPEKRFIAESAILTIDD